MFQLDDHMTLHRTVLSPKRCFREIRRAPPTRSRRISPTRGKSPRRRGSRARPPFEEIGHLSNLRPEPLPQKIWTFDKFWDNTDVANWFFWDNMRQHETAFQSSLLVGLRARRSTFLSCAVGFYPPYRFHTDASPDRPHCWWCATRAEPENPTENIWKTIEIIWNSSCLPL